LLIVDDDLKNIKAVRGYLQRCGYEVAVCQNVSESMEVLSKGEYALVLLDYHMPETMGDVAASVIREKFPNQQVAMFSCDLSRDAVKQSLRAGAIDFIEKSSSPEEILSRVKLYCERYETILRTIRKTSSNNKSENQKLIETLGLVGQSPQMAELALKVHKLAAVSDVSVLVRGESGTGKERIAKALHELSSRRLKPFIAINCAAIPRELLESELFGHKKGSFTGAVNDREGKFVAANGGTIFLDEIGDMPLELQAKLLRVLQERIVEPVGATVSKKIDVRVVSATHKNLESLVVQGTFRADLMYRLNAVEVAIPALRERLDDLESLVEHFTEAFNKKYGTNKYFQRRTLEILRKYTWPGNIRELDNIVEKHLVECDDIVSPEDIDLSLYNGTNVVPTETKLDQFEELQHKAKIEFIQKTIQQVGTKAEAARRLGIKPSLLHYILNSGSPS
jgi:two-component system NtrC family response regulator